MATLMKCLYCSRDMSSEFSECPHCQRVVPRSVFCCVCQEKMSSTDAIVKTRNKQEADTKYFHQRCHEQVLEEQVCPVCKYLFNESKYDKWVPSRYGHCLDCPNCGHTGISIRRCRFCHQGILERFKGQLYYAHTACGKGEESRLKAQSDAVYEQRRTAGQCIKCGERLGFLDRLSGREKHSYH